MKLDRMSKILCLLSASLMLTLVAGSQRLGSASDSGPSCQQLHYEVPERHLPAVVGRENHKGAPGAAAAKRQFSFYGAIRRCACCL